MAEVITTYDRLVNRLFRAALEAAERELGGEPSDWRVTFEGPDNVVVQAWRGQRFGTFAGRLDPRDRIIRGESYGTRRFSRG
jgi:hypothetical protein